MTQAKPRRKSVPNPDSRRQMLTEQLTDPDLADRIFASLMQRLPELRESVPDIDKRMEQLKEEIRENYGRQWHYLRARTKGELAAKVMAIFNGRNAREVARELNIGRTTVYRIIKQPGGDPK